MMVDDYSKYMVDTFEINLDTLNRDTMEYFDYGFEFYMTDSIINFIHPDTLAIQVF